MLDDLLNQYVDKFGVNFPVFMMMGKSENEISKLIRQALNEGKPYVPPDNDPNILY